MCKRNSFRHEQELRLVIEDDTAKGKPGILSKVDLDTIIESVHVAPLASDAFIQHIIDVLKSYGLSKRVTRSKMSAKGIFKPAISIDETK